ncbi:MAG: isoaspartyl peptidase/L-asparaginase [Planctomycetaceae bacterium]|nr:isoaspartyl peptidase/L-asparaginase [Planctomycetaceae bacterium]
MNRVLWMLVLVGSGSYPSDGYCVEPTSRFAIAIHGGAGRATSSGEDQQKVLRQALTTGVEMLEAGQSSLDTVETVIRILEDSPHFNAGKGAVFNAQGTHELDATIMDGRDRSTGAVGGITTAKNPISLARKVMTDTRHVLLVAEGADKFAEQYAEDPRIQLVPNEYFSTELRKEQYERIKAQRKQADRDSMGTVGCVVLDIHGNLAAGTSTGGLSNKTFGRLGDSPIAGAGTYADNATCAVSCTGIGEDFIRNAVAYDISARMAYRQESLESAIADILSNKEHPVRGGIIAVNLLGDIVMQFNTDGMSRAAADSTGRLEIH